MIKALIRLCLRVLLVCSILALAGEFQAKAIGAQRSDTTSAVDDTEGLISLLELSEAKQMALAENPDIEAARERVEISDALLGQAWSAFFPQINTSTGYLATNNKWFGLQFLLQADASGDQLVGVKIRDPAQNYNVNLSVTYDLFTFGKDEARKSAAQAERSAEVQSLHGVRNDLCFRVDDAYYRVAQLERLLKVREQALERSRELERVTKVRFEAGATTKAEALQGEVIENKAEADLVTTQNQVRIGWAILANVIGAPLKDRTLPSDVPMLELDSRLQTVESATVAAMAIRPELLELNERVDAAGHLVWVAQASRLPKLSPAFDLYYHNDLVGSDDASWYTGASLSMPIFTGGDLENKVRQARARKHELTADQRRLMLNLETEVETAYIELDTAEKDLQLSRTRVKSAVVSFDEMQSQYMNGSAILLQLDNALVNYVDALVSEIVASTNIQIARARIQRVAGVACGAIEHSDPEPGSLKIWGYE